MLDGRDQESLADGCGRRRQRQHIGFRAARGEHHVARLGRDQCRHPLPRLLDQEARGPALGMNRRRIAGRVERCQGRAARRGPQRCGGVPVEIDTITHLFLQYWFLAYWFLAVSAFDRRAAFCTPKRKARPIPFETLAFCPHTRARKRPPRPPGALPWRRCLPKSRMVINTYVHRSLPSSVL